MQVVEFIILGVLAGVVLFQLYAVLGRKVGRGPGTGALPQLEAVSGGTPGLSAFTPAGPAASLTCVAALRARDASYDPAQFLHGARQANQTIVKAFTEGDRATLKPLLASRR